MKTLLAYATKYGGTKECAAQIASRLPGTVTLLELSRDTQADLSTYDNVIVGSSVYIGKPRKEMVAFCKRYEKELLAKRLGLFLCCIQDLDKTVAEQMNLSFSKALREHAAVQGALGGVVNYTKLGRMDGFIMNMVAGDLRKKVNSDVISTLSAERIERFVRLLIA